MSDSEIAVTGLGMLSSLGSDPATNSAAMRAGLSRPFELAELAFDGDERWGGKAVVGYPVSFLAEGFTGPGRLFRLAVPALRGLCEQARLEANVSARTGVFLNLSDRYFESWLSQRQLPTQYPALLDENERSWEEERRDLVDRLTTREVIDAAIVKRITYPGGPAGPAQLFQESAAFLRSGQLDRCIVGAIDSYVDSTTLRATVEAGVLRTESNPAGFIPGEAAVFVLLETMASARERRAPVRAVLHGWNETVEPYHRMHEERSVGIGLADVVAKSLSATMSRQREIGLLIGNLNGDPVRAREWGYAITRLKQESGLDESPLWLPALSFGEVGAAIGLVALCLAIYGMERQYAPQGDVLVWLTSDSGVKSAFCVQRPN